MVQNEIYNETFQIDQILMKKIKSIIKNKRHNLKETLSSTEA